MGVAEEVVNLLANAAAGMPDAKKAWQYGVYNPYCWGTGAGRAANPPNVLSIISSVYVVS